MDFHADDDFPIAGGTPDELVRCGRSVHELDFRTIVIWDGFGFAQRIAPVKPEKLTPERLKPAAKRLIGLALAEDVGAALDQELHLLRGQRKPGGNGVQDARALRAQLIETQAFEKETDISTIRSAGERLHRHRFSFPDQSLAKIENAA